MAEFNKWFKSSQSGQDGCVEVMFEKIGLDNPIVHVRNSKKPDGPVVQFTKTEWEAFNSVPEEFRIPS